jgi:hypothetical protein
MDEVALRPPTGAISEIHAGTSLPGALDMVKSALVDMVDSLNVDDSTQLGQMIASSNEVLKSMLVPGGVLYNDPEQAISTVKILNEIKLRSLDIKRRCLDSAMRATSLLDSKFTLKMSLASTGGGPDVTPPPSFTSEAEATGSSFSPILTTTEL